MKKAFEKYFLSVVFILLTGLLQITANSAETDDLQNLNSSEDIHHAAHAPVTAHVLHTPSHDTFSYKKLLMEITESEELENSFKNHKQNQFSGNGSILTAFFYVLAWESKLTTRKLSSVNLHHAKPVLSKRYIQFEVFRI